MKTFSTEKKAEQWARAFDYSRNLLGLSPLEVQYVGDSWIVVDRGRIEKSTDNPKPSQATGA